MRIDPVFLFDLDGTLVDSVYQHVLAWKKALDAERIHLSVWRIHRKVGMSGGLFVNQLLRETGMEIDAERVRRLSAAHAAAYLEIADGVRPLPGARELLAWLTDAGVPWAIATSGRMETARVNLAALGVDPTRTPVVTRDQVAHAKPDPDSFSRRRPTAERAHHDGVRRRRQHMGHARRNPMPCAGGRPSERGLRIRRAAAIGRISRL